MENGKAFLEWAKKSIIGIFSITILLATTITLVIAFDSLQVSYKDLYSNAQSVKSNIISLDNTTIQVKSAFLADKTFTTPQVGEGVQQASAVSWNPYQEFTIISAPYGTDPSTESVPSAQRGGELSYQAALTNYRQREGANVYLGPVAKIFGSYVQAHVSVFTMPITSSTPQRVVMSEWVQEAGNRVWIVRTTKALAATNTDINTALLDFNQIEIASTDLSNPSNIQAANDQSSTNSELAYNENSVSSQVLGDQSVVLASSTPFALRKGVVAINWKTQAVNVAIDVYDPTKTTAYVRCVTPSGKSYVVGGDRTKIDYIINVATNLSTYGNGNLICYVYTYPHGAALSKIYTVAPTNIGTPPAPSTNLGSPKWWRGNCDTANYSARAGRPAYQLVPTTYKGLQACGPRPYWDGSPDVAVSFFSGAWALNEWECTELSERYLYLAYGVRPYPANGSQVVWNYSGSALRKISNGTRGAGPVAGDVLSMNPTSTAGHTAVVISTSYNSSGNGYIETLNENFGITQAYSLFRLNISNWYVQDSMPVTGWLHHG